MATSIVESDQIIKMVIVSTILFSLNILSIRLQTTEDYIKAFNHKKMPED